MIIRKAVDSDREFYREFAVKLSEFNRSNHPEHSKYDDYQVVLAEIRRKAEATFDARDEDLLILIAEEAGQALGYALGRIYEEDPCADNGTGRVGLFDELYLDAKARGHGLGQKLLDETMRWFESKGISRVKLHAYAWNETAKALYERNGFKEYAVSYEIYK